MEPLRRREDQLGVKDAAKLGAGMLCVSAAAFFYRAKRTTPFKIAYFFSWPILGGAFISTFGPNRQQMETELRQRGLDTQTLQVSRSQMQEQLNMLKGVAEEGRTRVSERWPQPEPPLQPMMGPKK